PFFFFFLRYGAHLDLHSFPTRRSSDLPEVRGMPSLAHYMAQYDHEHESASNKLLHAIGIPMIFAGIILVLFLKWIWGTALFLGGDRKSTRLNSSHVAISYAVFCLKKKK